MICSLATQLNDYSMTFEADPAAVLGNQTALANFTSTLQTQMGDFFGVDPMNVLVNNVYETIPTRRREMLARLAKASGFTPYTVDLSGGLWSGSLKVDSIVHTNSRAVAKFDLAAVSSRARRDGAPPGKGCGLVEAQGWSLGAYNSRVVAVCC